MNKLLFLISIVMTISLTTNCTNSNQVKPELIGLGLDLVIYDLSYSYCKKAISNYGYEAYLGLKIINNTIDDVLIPILESDKIYLESFEEWSELIDVNNYVSERIVKVLQRIIDKITGLIPSDDMNIFWKKNESTKYTHVLLKASFYSLRDAINDSLKPFHRIFGNVSEPETFHKLSKLSFLKEF